MGDDRCDREARLEHHGHLVPSVVHFPAVDALDRDHVEDDRRPVHRHFLGRNAQHGNLSSMAHVREHFPEGRFIARHFQTHVESFAHGEFLLGLGNGHLRWVESHGHSHPASER